jgi:hypothetical protein
MAFQDRGNYLRYAESSDGILFSNISSGVLPTLFNEPLWLLINMGLNQLVTPEGVMRAIIFIGAFTLSYCLLKSDPKNAFWLMLFLLTTPILKNYITHLRQGLGISVFFAGYLATSKFRSWPLMVAAPFIHSSFFIVLLIAAIPKLLQKIKLGIDVRLLVLALFGLGICLSLGIITEILGARQAARYEFEIKDNLTGLGWFFWFSITALFITQGKRFFSENQAALGILVFYLISYFLIEVTARVFNSGFLLVFLAGLELYGWRRYAFLSAYFSYAILQWILKLRSPMPF